MQTFSYFAQDMEGFSFRAMLRMLRAFVYRRGWLVFIPCFHSIQGIFGPMSKDWLKNLSSKQLNALKEKTEGLFKKVQDEAKVYQGNLGLSRCWRQKKIDAAFMKLEFEGGKTNQFSVAWPTM